jgi:hypothetical protein
LALIRREVYSKVIESAEDGMDNETAGWCWAYDNLARGIKTPREIQEEAGWYPLAGWEKGALAALEEWRSEVKAGLSIEEGQ